MMMQARFLALGLSCVALAACASPVEQYPSLAIRDSEQWSGTMAVPDAQPYVPAPPAEATLGQVEQLAAQARSVHSEFLAAAPAARQRANAARGAGTGSDAWSDAQVVIADLEARRSQTMIALADLDRLYIETSTAGEAVASIAVVRDEVVALVDQENALIAELLSTVGG